MISALRLQANLIRCSDKMFIFLYIFLLAFQHVHASTPTPSSPTSPLPTFPTQLENAAVWHQAVAMDAELNANNSNQEFYLQLGWWQILENSSISYLAGGTSGMDTGPVISKSLQYISNYPVRFDRAQASNPEQTPSRQDPINTQSSRSNIPSQSSSLQFLNKRSNLSVRPAHGGRTISTTFPSTNSRIYHSFFSPKTGSI